MPKKSAGYSGTPLAKKLGFKEGFHIWLIQQPEYYFELFAELLPGLNFEAEHMDLDCIHMFTKSAADLEHYIPIARQAIKQNGMIWVSWPKKASKVVTDMTEDVVRKYAFANDLVDIKVCAVDQIWSGLKLVIPKTSRKDQ